MPWSFRVIWEMENEADSPKDAAQVARVIQLTHGTSATVFVVGRRIGEDAPVSI
jgi:hypothetical protein